LISLFFLLPQKKLTLNICQILVKKTSSFSVSETKHLRITLSSETPSINVVPFSVSLSHQTKVTQFSSSQLSPIFSTPNQIQIIGYLQILPFCRNTASISNNYHHNHRSARFFSSDTVTSDYVEETPNSSEGDDDLRSRILRLRLPKRSATNVLQKWVLQGNSIPVSELRDISKELRSSQRYKHALEVFSLVFSPFLLDRLI